MKLKKWQLPIKKISLLFAPALILMAPPALSTAQNITLPDSMAIPTAERQKVPTANRQKELTYMVQQDCGSCHGMTLKGGLGPSLLPERISVLPKDYLVKAITHGRPGTPMPPWAPLLTPGEIHWIVEQLQLGQLGQVPESQVDNK